MKEFTKYLIEEERKDTLKIYKHNNTRERNRTPEQTEQHKRDKRNYYERKWKKLLSECETESQKNHCNTVLNKLHLIR